MTKSFERVIDVAVGLAGIALFVAIGWGTHYALTHLLPGVTSSWRLAWHSSCRALAFGFATWLIGHRLGKRSWADMGWRGATIKPVLRGVGIGALLATVAVVLAPALSVAAVRVTPDPAHYLVAAVPLVVGLLPAALAEELLYRGYALRRLSAAVGPGAALFLTPLVFAATHLSRPHATFFTSINIALAGLWLGLAFFSPGGLPLAWGLHFGWNAALALFDAPVSGYRFVDLPGIEYLPGRHAWLDGGAFGPEGGVLVTLVLLAGTIVLCGGRFSRVKHWPGYGGGV